MYGCLSIILLTAVSGACSVLFTSSSASASSIFDQKIETTETLKLNVGNTTYCPEYSMETQWASVVTTKEKWNNQGQFAEFSGLFKSAVAQGSYGVIARSGYIWIIGSTRPGKLIWQPNGDYVGFVSDQSDAQYFQIGLYDKGSYNGNTGQCGQPIIAWAGTDTKNSLGYTYIIDSPHTNGKIFLMAGVDFNYPPNYAGQQIQGSWTAPADNKLRFGWSVDQDGNVSAVDSQNVHADMIKNCGVTWTLYNSTIEYQKGSVVDTKTQPQTKEYDYGKIPQGYYILEEKPNACVPFVDDGKIQAGTQNIEFKGLFIGGMSGTNKESSTIFGENNPLSQFGLTQAINAPLLAIQRLATTSCTPITLPMFNGSNITAPCTSAFYSAKLPAVYTFWQIALTGMVAYAVAIGIIRHTKVLLNPDDDRIEVISL